MKLYSFDIFDTLITRRVANPTGIFVLMQNELKTSEEYSDFPEELKDNFFMHRTDAEYRQRRLHNLWKEGIDISFDQIYEDIQNTLCLSDDQIAKLKKLEIKLEIENILPIEENINKLKLLVEKGKRVVLISDMYLPEEVIKQLLNCCDPILITIPLYLSSTLGVMKSKGDLYTYVQEKEGVSFSSWTHIGDNKRVDFDKAKELGIKAEIYPYVSLKPYEQQILNSFAFHSPYMQLAIGCSKNIRLRRQNRSLMYELGTSLAACIFYPYITWLLDISQKQGLTRLYFIARDGYILKSLADFVISERNINIQTKYIYGSRKAWRLPSLSLNNTKLYEQYIETAFWSLKNIEDIFGISEENFASLLPKALRNYKNLPADKSRELKDFLLGDTTVRDEVISKGLKKRFGVVNYLKQEIDTTDDNFAFVDLDGSGFTQNCLAELMSEFYTKKITSFYLASTPAYFEPINVRRVYFYSLKTPLMAHHLELLTKAPHGQTLGYTFDKNIWQPILEENEPVLAIEDYLEGLKDFAKDMTVLEQKNSKICFQNIYLMLRYIDYLFSSPDKETANLLGSLHHKFAGSEKNDFAPSLTFIDSIKYLFTNKIDSESLEYSKQRSHKLTRKVIEYKQKHPKLLNEVFSVHISRRKGKAYMKILGIKISFRKLLNIK